MRYCIAFAFDLASVFYVASFKLASVVMGSTLLDLSIEVTVVAVAGARAWWQLCWAVFKTLIVT